MEDIPVKITAKSHCKTIDLIKDGKYYCLIGNRYHYNTYKKTMYHMVQYSEKKEDSETDYVQLSSYWWLENGICLKITKYKNNLRSGKQIRYNTRDPTTHAISME